MATAQATTHPQLGFPTKGSLKRFPFPRLMREIARARLTGSLYLLNGQTKKVVFFEEGQPVFVRSNVLSECLGQILTSEGLITQEQCEQTLEAIRRTGKKQGELLVEMGILSEGNLRYALEAQLRTKLFDIFSWEDGRFQFKTDPAGAQFGVRLKLAAEGVIVSAVQDQYPEERAMRALEPVQDKFPLLAEGLELETGALDLLPEEIHLASCLDGSRSVIEVLDQPIEPSVPTPRALLHGLMQAGLVRLSDERLAARDRPDPPDLDARGSDEELAPTFVAQDVVTEYEDTPLPGELPQVRGLLGDHEAAFDEVASDEVSITSVPVTGPHSRVEVSEDLVAAEPETEEETFDDDIELLEEELEIVEQPTELEPELLSGAHELETVIEGLDDTDDALAVDDDLALPADLELSDDEADLLLSGDENERSDDGGAAQPAGGSGQPAHLLGLDELDDIDLGGDDLGAASYEESEAMAQETDDPEMVGAMRFNEAETAMSDGDFVQAVTLLEDAYENGFDVAELHAMLAYARFVASGQDTATAQHAFELLDYAQNMDPSLDLVHAYRGAIYQALDDPDRAREALDRALELNPYCELAIEVMDQLSSG
jgi:tetratricopeptide (TPR) repeat protein